MVYSSRKEVGVGAGAGLAPTPPKNPGSGNPATNAAPHHCQAEYQFRLVTLTICSSTCRNKSREMEDILFKRAARWLDRQELEAILARNRPPCQYACLGQNLIRN